MMRKSRIDDSSGKSQQRQSRIPGPKRSTLGKGDRRSVSEDRGAFSLKKNSLAVPRFSSRPSSASRATPMRTPMRTPLMLGGSTDRKKTPLNDKKWFQDQLTRIFDYIGKIEGLDGNFVSSRNIRLMSIKDFLRIVCHLAKFWMPRVNLSNDYVEEIAEILRKLRYPYNFNKSWLKTPNAPHSLNHIVVIISWLLDGVPECRRPVAREALPVECTDFPTRAFAEFFEESVQNAYQMWNDGDDEGSAAIHREIASEYISERFNMPNEVAMKREITKLERECAELQVEADELEAKEDSVEKLKKQLDDKKKQHTKLAEETIKMEKETAMGAQKVADLEKTLMKMREMETNIREKCEQQQKEGLPQKFEQLLMKLGEEKIKHQSMMDLTKKIQGREFNEVHVQKARLMKKYHDIINEVNLELQKLSQLFPTELQLPPSFHWNDLTDEAKADLLKNARAVSQKISIEIAEKEMEIISLKNAIEIQGEIKEKLLKSVESLKEEYSRVEKMLLKNDATAKSNFSIMQEDMEKEEGKIAKIQEEIEEKEAEIVQLEAKQEAMLEAFDKDSTEKLDAKRGRLEKYRQTYMRIRERLLQSGLFPKPEDLQNNKQQGPSGSKDSEDSNEEAAGGAL